ncbi:MBL fold metallo-hydrolase [Nonomuraea longicatena]|uniref:MBL fold metallo-hydrolase n=1 Tax=Nonomuraea longicatena TaxID=83682 RepID=A0ABN1NMD3_9ACTN
MSYVPDGAVRLKPRAWLPETTDQVWADHPEYLDEAGELVASVGGLLVEQGERALLIDAGFGPMAWPSEPQNPHSAIHGGDLLDNLAVLGRRPEEIEAVAFTHLHIDHIGWAWNPAPGTAEPAFTRAEYLVAEPEWTGRELYPMTEENRAIVAVLEPKVRTVADGEEVFPGVHVRITQGHTHGHAVYTVTGGGRRLIAFGDALHSPIQVAHPEWSAASDHDPVHAANVRRELVADLAGPETIGFGIHFADAVFGRVRQNGSGAVWEPLD